MAMSRARKDLKTRLREEKQDPEHRPPKRRRVQAGPINIYSQEETPSKEAEAHQGNIRPKENKGPMQTYGDL